VSHHPAFSSVSSPAWSEPSEDDSTGRDFLGTMAVNLAMLARLTGAYNNVVTSARQHAIVTWAAWRYRENCRAAGTDPTNKQFRDFLDAVETIQLVGQREVGPQFGGTTEGLGSRSLKQLGDGPTIPLRFKKYGRSHDNTSALAAVQYGPSAKPGSFGFLGVRSGIWGPTSRGERLAHALDPLLRTSDSYALLARFPVPETMARSAAIDLATHGLVIGSDLPARPEREPYIDALFDLDGVHSRGHERRLTLALILETVGLLEDDDGVTAWDIRMHFLSGCTSDGKALSLPDYLHGTAQRWQVFQLRQLQRYALEAWLCLAELLMPCSANLMVESITESLHGLDQPDDDLASLLERPSAEIVGMFLNHREIDDVLAWALSGEATSPWELLDEIKDSFNDGPPMRAVPGILSLTLTTLALCDVLVLGQERIGFAQTGDRRRISLVHFKAWWAGRASVPFREALTDMLEELVLQQHVAVAVARFDNEQRRLRFSNDELGWEMLPGSDIAIPSLTPDRILALLRLMTDLALLEEENGAFLITDAGRDVLRRVQENEGAAGSGGPIAT
jgi:hypothetical protein